MDEFDDNDMGLPEDIAGGAGLGDLDAGVEDIEIEIEGTLEPAGRASGGARAGKSPLSRKPAAPKAAAAAKKAPAKAKAAPVKKAKKKAAPVRKAKKKGAKKKARGRKTARKGARKGRRR